MPRDERRDLSKRKRAVARPAVAREDVEEDGAAEEGVGGIIKGVVVAVPVEIKFRRPRHRRDEKELTHLLISTQHQTSKKRERSRAGCPL